MKKYAVFSHYNYNCDKPFDILTITHATKEALELDGSNQCGVGSAFYLECFEKLDDAIHRAAYWPTSIRYGEDFSDEEKAIVVSIANELMKNPDFCKKFRDQSVIAENVGVEKFQFNITMEV